MDNRQLTTISSPALERVLQMQLFQRVILRGDEAFALSEQTVGRPRVVAGKLDHSSRCKILGRSEQLVERVGIRGTKILRVTWIADKHRRARVRTSPENLARDELGNLLRRSVKEGEVLMTNAVAAAGNRNRLALAALEQLELLVVERLARRVDGDPEREIAVERWQDFLDGLREVERDVGVKSAANTPASQRRARRGPRFSVVERDAAVNDVPIAAALRRMKRPFEIDAHGKSVQGDAGEGFVGHDLGKSRFPAANGYYAAGEVSLVSSSRAAMTKDERKRVAALIEAAECLFLENLALKLVLEYREVPNWQKLLNKLMEDEELMSGVRLKFSDLYEKLERVPNAEAALDMLIGRLPKPKKPH